MAKLIRNFQKPAPRWFRVTATIVYALVSSSILTGTLDRFGVPSSDQNLVIGWLILLIETLRKVLANGEVYTKDTETGSSNI